MAEVGGERSKEDTQKLHYFYLSQLQSMASDLPASVSTIFIHIMFTKAMYIIEPIFRIYFALHIGI